MFPEPLVIVLPAGVERWGSHCFHVLGTTDCLRVLGTREDRNADPGQGVRMWTAAQFIFAARNSWRPSDRRP